MSFSSDVKEELGKQFAKSKHCQLAELAGIIEITGRIDEEKGSLVIESDNTVLIAKYALLMKRLFGIDISVALSREDTRIILSSIKKTKLPISAQKTDEEILIQTCCKRAFIRGVFLASGSVSDPNKSYHFEIVCKVEEQAKQIREILVDFGTDAKIVERKGHYVVYLKEGENIVDALNVMEAYVSLMKFENIRILKDMRNAVNRKVNCETANISKTVNAAVKQIQDIELIREKRGLDSLPDNLKEIALLRLEYPDMALKELGNYLQPPVGKSGVNHRFRKIAAIAEELK